MIAELLLTYTVTEFTDLISNYADSAWLLMFVLAVATLVSEDLACIAGGLLAAQGNLSLVQAIVGSGLGIWLGDIALYGLGYGVAHGLSLPKRFTPSGQGRWLRMFDKYGGWWIALTRILPGTRFPSYVLAGLVLSLLFFS